MAKKLQARSIFNKTTLLKTTFLETTMTTMTPQLTTSRSKEVGFNCLP